MRNVMSAALLASAFLVSSSPTFAWQFSDESIAMQCAGKLDVMLKRNLVPDELFAHASLASEKLKEVRRQAVLQGDTAIQGSGIERMSFEVNKGAADMVRMETGPSLDDCLTIADVSSSDIDSFVMPPAGDAEAVPVDSRKAMSCWLTMVESDLHGERDKYAYSIAAIVLERVVTPTIEAEDIAVEDILAFSNKYGPNRLAVLFDEPLPYSVDECIALATEKWDSVMPFTGKD